ncbi:nuclease A inhibitor family protein [Pontibacter rugosus]
MEIEKLRQELQTASKGLLMLSETDAPFEFFYHQPISNEQFNPDTVALWDGQESETPVETLPIDKFLFRMQHPPSGADAQARALAEQFKLLQDKLQELLQEPKAYKIGQVNMPVYLIGRTESGAYAGLKTVVVET